MFVAVTAPGDHAALHLDPVVSGWGSTGVVATDAPIPYWVIGTVEVEAEVEQTGVRLSGLEVFDADGNALGQGDRELELRLAGPSTTDFSQHGTSEFSGTLPAAERVRLRFSARMDDAFGTRLATPPHTFKLTLTTDQGVIARMTAPIGGPWPTG